MMNGKNCLKMLFLLACTFVIGMAKPDTAQAANPTMVNLQTNRTYASYDITGDQKNDYIKIKADASKKKISVVINEKTVYTARPQFEEVVANIYTLKNGKPFLYLLAAGVNDGGEINGVFQYKGGKLKQVINFNTFFGKYGNNPNGQILSVEGNTMKTRYFIMSWATGVTYINVDYQYKSGTLKRTSNILEYAEIYRVSDRSGNARTFRTNKSIQAYTTAKANKKAFTIPKNAKVRIDKCYCNGKKMMIRVKYNGKYGWIKPQKKFVVNDSDRQFAGVLYAG